MRLISMFAGLGCAASTLLAQPDFTASSVFQVGDSSALGYALVLQPFEEFVPKTGTAYIWDFSGNTSPGPWTNWAKPTTPYLFREASKSMQATFAASEINEYSALGFPRNLFYTYSAAKDTLYYDGLQTNSNYLYRPRIPYLAFPLKFNDSGKVRVEQFGNTAQPTVKTGSVDRMWHYDGYGTVKFPYGEAQDVFRIRTRQNDTIMVGTFVSGTQYDELIWFRKSDGIPVLRMAKNGTTINAYIGSAEPGSGIVGGDARARNRLWVEEGGGFLALRSLKPASHLRIHDFSGRLAYSAPASGDRIRVPSLPGGLHFFHLAFSDGTSQRVSYLMP